MLSDYFTDDLFVLLAVPLVVAIIWAIHLTLRIRASHKAIVTMWILMAGLPAVTVLLFFWSTSIPATYTGIAEMSTTGYLIMKCSFITFALWILVAFLEFILLLSLGSPKSRRAELRRS